MRQRKKTVTIVAAGVLLVLGVVACSWLKAISEGSFPEWQKGMAYVSWTRGRYGSASSDESLEALAQTGTEWVALVTTWYQDGFNSTSIRPAKKSPNDDSLVHAIKKIHSLGMKVMLKPHIDLLDVSEGKWRGDIEFYTDSDWEAWFESYRDFILHYARIAQEHNVELLCIGTELSITSTTKGDLWREIIIKSVRDVYKGPLTYAANWYEEYDIINFWDALDYAGLDPYFPLANEAKPTREEIVEGWKPWVKDIEAWQARIKKPVIFAEIGYKSAGWSARDPWEHMPGRKVDLQQQADCYEALFQTFWDKPWFYGIYWWEWGTTTRRGGELNRGFTPQNKPAQEVLSEWYKKPVVPRERSVYQK